MLIDLCTKYVCVEFACQVLKTMKQALNIDVMDPSLCGACYADGYS